MATGLAPFSQRVIDAVTQTNEFAGMLPKQYRSAAERFLKCARLYIATCNHRDKLQKCTIGSIVTSIMQAAKFGIMIDGKQGHLVPFNTKVKDANGQERWENLAQFIADYKGLINVAKRCGVIVDAFAEHVHEGDLFSRRFYNGKWTIEYEPATTERGDYLGTFATLVFDGERFKVEYMDKAEIEDIRQRSKSKDSGPWVDSFGEMARKTVIKRALKTYLDDPELMELVGLDDEISGVETIDTTATPVKGIKRAAPLAITHDEENISFADMQEEPKVEPVKRQPKKQEQKRVETEVDYSAMFAHCKSLESVEQTARDIEADDPTVVINSNYMKTVRGLREQMKGGDK